MNTIIQPGTVAAVPLLLQMAAEFRAQAAPGDVDLSVAADLPRGLIGPFQGIVGQTDGEVLMAGGGTVGLKS